MTVDQSCPNARCESYSDNGEFVAQQIVTGPDMSIGMAKLSRGSRRMTRWQYGEAP